MRVRLTREIIVELKLDIWSSPEGIQEFPIPMEELVVQMLQEIGRFQMESTDQIPAGIVELLILEIDRILRIQMDRAQETGLVPFEGLTLLEVVLGM